MKNVEIKKNILALTKRVKGSFRIEITIWHGQTTEHDNGIWGSIDVYKGLEGYDLIEGDEIPSLFFGADSLEDTEENMEILKKDQKKVHDYLIKHFDNVAMKNENV